MIREMFGKSITVANVDQVRQRRPFLSLTDFINRRLHNDDSGRIGSLQSAIDVTNANSKVLARAF